MEKGDLVRMPTGVLGKTVRGAIEHLETIERAGTVPLARLKMTSDEVTALCPVTGQPDQYTVEVEYQPIHKCIESKSLKLYLQGFRNKGVFVEDLAAEIWKEVHEVANAPVQVKVTQKSRGGVTIVATVGGF